MAKANAAESYLWAIAALALMVIVGSAQAARTSNTLEADGDAVSVPTGPRSQTSAVAVQLPKGASAISETYGDWIVKCLVDSGTRLCTLSQSQLSKETNQQVFAIELLPRDGKTEGNMLVPFGLKLDAGAILKLDGKDLEQARFSTCTAQGCLLPVSFSTGVTETMSRAKILTVAVQNISNGQAIVVNVPLNGFAAALERTIQLGS